MNQPSTLETTARNSQVSAVRLIALDIDGTLLDSSFSIPKANLEAIASAVEQGIEVVLVTGRRFDFALPIAWELPSPLTMIVNNGALVKSKDGATHLRHLLPVDTARKILELMDEYRKDAAVVFDRPRARQIIYEMIDWEDPRRRPYLLRNVDYIAEVCPIEDCLTEDPIQVMYAGSVDAMRQAESRLRAAANREAYALAVTYYESRDFGMVDIIHPRCSKGATLAEWAERRSIGRGEIMAIGDNFNDREMLEYAGLPIVMGNGIPELKAMGWRETLTNDEAGVAAAIHQYALGNA